MFANQSMRAYLDDFHKIVVEVKKTFYGGHIDSFYIRSKNTYERIVIERVEETADLVIYTTEFKGEINFSERYTLVENHGLQAALEVRFVVKTQKFERLFSYDGDDLGAIYHPKHTDFALWAPTANAVDLELHLNGEIMIYRMRRTERGVHRYSVRWDLANAHYIYLVHVNNEVIRTGDPYAMSSTANALLSAVIDERKLPIMISTEKCAKIKNYTDAIIYEGHIRDFTSLYSAGTKTHGLFNSLMETGTTCNQKSTGLDYLKELGFTHIQLLPVADFATVDEFYPMYQYNWGYDPLQYGVPEGSFSSDPMDPYARVIEFRKLVNTFHSNGIMVIMDVVYNHMYDVRATMMHNCCPYYYFRYDENKQLSNGSFCGNDFDSTMYMSRKLILDTLKRWMNVYGVDGFRFDLMGILDIETMNQVSEMVRSIKPYGMVYGEGWNMPTALDNDTKAMMYNHAKLNNIAFFNDRFRDYLKGKTGDYDKMDQGFLTGDLSMTAAMAGVLSGSCLARYGSYFDDPNKSINYVECHDNATLWDKMAECCGNESEDMRRKRQKMINAAVLFAQGIPFLHAGQEFLITKGGNTNSYNSPDNINGIDWIRRANENDVVEYTKACISLRKEYAGFRLATAKEIEEKVSVNYLSGSILSYEINHVGKIAKRLRVLFNPTNADIPVDLGGEWLEILDDKGRTRHELSKCVMPGLSIKVLIQRNA